MKELSVYINKSMQTPFTSLPIEMLLEIMLYLDPISLLRFARVNKFSANISKESLLWRNLTVKHFPWHDKLILRKSVSWKTLFRFCWKTDLEDFPIESRQAFFAFYWVREAD